MPTYAVFGNPIAHSLSPQLQNAFAAQFHFTIDYQKQLAPLDRFNESIDAFRAQGGLGANITIPFKTEAVAYADQLTDRATIAGAVNTFIFKQNVCVGDNTDGVGLLRDVQNNLGISLEHKNILILGAGGATRGILNAIIQTHPQQLFLYNRTANNAEKLIHAFQQNFFIQPYHPEHKIDLVINASAINFAEMVSLEINLSETICYDLNYGERHHTFSTWAAHRGAPMIFDGLGMLVEQGAESFYQWFEKRPETSSVITMLRKGQKK